MTFHLSFHELCIDRSHLSGLVLLVTDCIPLARSATLRYRVAGSLGNTFASQSVYLNAAAAEWQEENQMQTRPWLHATRKGVFVRGPEVRPFVLQATPGDSRLSMGHSSRVPQGEPDALCPGASVLARSVLCDPRRSMRYYRITAHALAFCLAVLRFLAF